MNNLRLQFFYILFFIFLISLDINAQVGINIDGSSSTLDIKANSSVQTDKVISLKTVDNKEVFHFKNNGNISNHEQNSSIKLDLRSNENQTIGIGFTDLTALEAKAGAIRYDKDRKVLQFSNEITWIDFMPGKDRIFVLADNSSRLTFVPSGGVAGGRITGWTVQNDSTNSFDPVTGLFTAPREGIYNVTATIVFDNTEITGTPRYELALSTPESGTGLKNVVVFFGGVGTSLLANSCRTLFYLKQGETVYLSVYFTGLRGSLVLAADPSLNVITIAEM